MKFKIFILYFFTLSLFLQAQAPISNISADHIKYGEPVVLKILVKAHKNDTIIFPTIIDTLSAKFEVLENKKDTLTKGNFCLFSDSIIFSAYESGVFTVPPQRVLVNSGEYFTPAYKITVEAVPTDSIKTPLFDIKNIIKEPKNGWDYLREYWIYVAIIMGILLVFMAAFIIFYLLKRQRKKLVNPIINPDIIAFKRLKKLKKSNYLEKGLNKKYYSELTAILKDYMESLWDFPATKLLSDDLLDYIKKEKWVDQREIENLTVIFNAADLAKFAKYKPTIEDTKLYTDFARNFINSTKTKSSNNKTSQDEQ